MKTTARVILLVFAGLALAGCATNTAQLKTAPAKVASTWGEQPLSAKDYFLQQDYQLRIDRTRAQP